MLHRAVNRGAVDVLARHAAVLCQGWKAAQLSRLAGVRVVWVTSSLDSEATQREMWQGTCP